MSQLSSNFFEARSQIHGRTDTGAIKSISTSNVAVENLTHVQSEAEANFANFLDTS